MSFMKFFITKNIIVLLFPGFVLEVAGQYNWKLARDKDGIKVYESKTKNSGFKSVKVESTLQGSFDKFIEVLNNVSHYKDWVYRTKTCYVIKRISSYELYYYIETILPWPMSNRDATMHLRIDRDSLNRFLKVETTSELHLLPEKNGKVRVPYSSVNWYITMPSAKTIHVTYIFEVNPGGEIPAWLSNMFVDEGAYETFRKLSEILNK
jgi:START domain